MLKHCVCIENDEGKNFCCTRKTSTAKFIQQFMLWSIKSCTTSVASAAKCLWKLPTFVTKATRVLKCFADKSGKKLSKGDLENATQTALKDVKDSLSYGGSLFGEEILDQMFDGRNKALLAQDLDTPRKRLYHVAKAFLQASEHVSPHGLNDRSLNKSPDNMDDHSGS